MPVLRGVAVSDEKFLVGEPDPVRSKPPWYRPPPPPPPPVPLLEREDDEPAGAASPWSPPWVSTPSADRDAIDDGRHPLEEEVREKLAEAERMLAEAQESADDAIAEARRQAAELVEQAQAELARAREEAERLKAEVAAELERVRDEAQAAGHVAGYDAGYAEGVAKAELATAEKVAHVTRLAISAAVDRRELLHNAEAEVVRLATRIAAKVIQRELATDPTIVHRMAEVALRHVAADGLVRLRVNPADLDELRSYWDRTHGMAEADRTYEIVGDASIQRGGVVIETRAGSVDAQIEAQLAEIADALGVDDAEELPVEAPPDPLVELARQTAGDADDPGSVPNGD